MSGKIMSNRFHDIKMILPFMVLSVLSGKAAKGFESLHGDDISRGLGVRSAEFAVAEVGAHVFAVAGVGVCTVGEVAK
jgi:hypothetical protein